MMIEAATAWAFLHVLGVAMGLGGAVSFDLLLLRGAVLSPVEPHTVRSVRLLSRVVAFGLTLLWISGAVLTWLSVSKGLPLLDAAKFQAKVLIVVALSLNGAAIHAMALSALERSVGEPLFVFAPGWLRLVLAILAGVSITSWSAAMLLGLARELVTQPVTVGHILGVYVACVAFMSLAIFLLGVAARPRPTQRDASAGVERFVIQWR